MTIQQKIVLDRLVAKPFACFLNLIAWPLGQMISLDHDDAPEKVKVIAIAKLLGIGSILKAIVLVQALKKRYPSSKYIFITSLKNKPLAESMSFFDECLYINDASLVSLSVDLFILLSRLWKQKIDLYFDLEVYSAFSTILSVLSLSRNRYGFYRDTTRFRLGLNTHLVYFNDHQRIAKIYLQFARACGIKDVDADYPAVKLHISEKAKEELGKWMENEGIQKGTPFMAINPNASDLALERRWPLVYFSALINALAASWRNPVFLVGSPDEYAYNTVLEDSLSQDARGYIYNCAGKISLMAAVALVSQAKLVITNDSGFYHIAGIFSIPTISFWGPASPSHYADTARLKDFIFYAKDIYCSPCVHRTESPPCRGNNICMYSIPPKEVYIKACEILGIAPSADTAYMEHIYQTQIQRDLDITIRYPKKGR
jgi:ADP-heptose:LPS heptosyltransferase